MPQIIFGCLLLLLSFWLAYAAQGNESGVLFSLIIVTWAILCMQIGETQILKNKLKKKGIINFDD